MDEEIRAHYATGIERERLASGGSKLEFARTKELLDRYLPPLPASILDVGGGPGEYAAWLAERGYEVRLVDPVPLHVEQAQERGLDAVLGDARRLDEPTDSTDVVLLLGPLYHLTERDDRVRALEEAGRVVRRGGLVAAAAISRFASLLDGLSSRFLDDPRFAAIVENDLATGQHRNPDAHEGWFTTSYFHHPSELPGEIGDAGLRFEALYGLEGPGWLFPDLFGDDRAWETLLRAARLVEREPTLLALSAHLLALATRVRP